VLASVLHIEGAEAIDPNFEFLDVLYEAGLRSLGPVWSRSNAFGHCVPFRCPSSPDTGPGLTDLGKELIDRCNRLRILIDLSHLNERGFWDVAAISNAPFVATHWRAFRAGRPRVERGRNAGRGGTRRRCERIHHADGGLHYRAECRSAERRAAARGDWHRTAPRGRGCSLRSINSSTPS
jgi:hypothetical protein